MPEDKPPRKRAPRKAAPKADTNTGKRVAGQRAKPTVTDADRTRAAEQAGKVVPMKRPAARAGGPARNRNRTSPEALDVHDRRVRAMNLRRLGATWAQVAAELREQPGVPAGYDAAAAYRDVKTVLDSVTVEAVQDLRNEDLGILASLMRTAYPRALAGEDPVWMDKVLKILDARAKYTGLYAPQRIALAGPGGGPITLAAASPEEVYAQAMTQLNDLLPPPPALPAGPSS